MFEQEQIIVITSLALIISLAITVIITRWTILKKFDQKTSLNEDVSELITQHNTLTAVVELANEELALMELRTIKLQQLEESADEIASQLNKDTISLSQMRNDLMLKTGELSSMEINLNQLMSKVDLYSRVDELVEFGMFDEPDYLFKTSLRYKEKIKHIRSMQKDMITDGLVITGNDSTTVEGVNNVEAKRVIKGQSVLMIKTFNIEADFLMSKVNPANYTKTMERINKLADGIEKHSISFKYGISDAYIELKYEECTLNYQCQLVKQNEIEEQKVIRELIKEEERAAKEFQKAIADAEKEEELYSQLLDKAQRELKDASEDEVLALEKQIQQLQDDLEQSKLNGTRAMSMAQQTRRGHVYVISNIGSFGEDVYKIGLTRRLEPLDRVKELGDASVPFKFDVHAMIAVDDAPALESALHKEFTHMRVNAVNHRKEFFRVDLQSIKEAVETLTEFDVEFTTTIAAEEYYQSKRLKVAVG